MSQEKFRYLLILISLVGFSFDSQILYQIYSTTNNPYLHLAFSELIEDINDQVQYAEINEKEIEKKASALMERAKFLEEKNEPISEEIEDQVKYTGQFTNPLLLLAVLLHLVAYLCLIFFKNPARIYVIGVSIFYFLSGVLSFDLNSLQYVIFGLFTCIVLLKNKHFFLPKKKVTN